MIDIIGCVNPDTVIETDYLASINKDERPEFKLHLKDCAYCQTEVEAYRKFDSLMHKNFRFIVSSNRTLCIETQKLGEYALDLLHGIEERNVTYHLAVCSFCQEEYESLKNWLPEKELTPTLPKSTPTKPSWLLLPRVIARIIGTNQPQSGAALVGVRGSGDRGPQIFQAEEVQLTIMVQPAGSRRSDLLVEGLVQRLNTELKDLEGAEVRLLKDSILLGTEVIDDIGNFVFESVISCKKFDLEITLSDKIVIVPGIATD
jgi:hypothetical protein